MKYIIYVIIITFNLNANDFIKNITKCDHNLSKSCRELAFLSLEVHHSYDESEKYFLKACDLKDAKSCRLLSYIYRSKRTNKRDKKKQFNFLKKACQLGHPNACTALGHRYYSKINSGKIDKKDLLQGNKSYKKACELGDQDGCYNLGTQYLNKYGIEKDRKEAIKLFKKSCQINYRGCSLYLNLIIGKDLNISEFTILSKECKSNISSSCNNLGFLSFEVYHDYNKAEKYFTKACHLQNQESCKILAFLYESERIGKRDLKKSFYYFDKACKLGSRYSCFYEGFMYSVGEGIKKDIVKSTKLYQKSCNMGNTSGCTFLGDRYRLGRGIKVDKRKAIEIYKKACNNGGHLACIKYISFSVGLFTKSPVQPSK